MTAAEEDLVTCESCGKDVLPLFELQGEEAVEADVLCSACAGDDATTGSGAPVPTPEDSE